VLVKSFARKKFFDIRLAVKPSVRALIPYDAKEIPCKVKLDANESPYGFEISRKIIKSISTNRYPDPEAKALREAYARSIGLKSTSWLLHGNGSDEIIYNLIATFGGPVLVPAPTFSMYATIGQALGERVVRVPLDYDFDLDLRRMLSQIEKRKPRLIFLSSPNNPTGNRFSEEKIIKIIKASPGVVVVDEAYEPFAAGGSFIPYLRKYNNLLVLRTLSKIGLAALRTGFLVGRPEAINEVNRVRLPFNLNALSQAIAAEILNNSKEFNKHIKEITSGREWLMKELMNTGGVFPFPSEANFILFKVKDPARVYKSLLENGVLIRDLSRALKGCLRVTVGTKKENESFIKSIREAMNEA
jgi:histidinol-phosphate aminotransferase